MTAYYLTDEEAVTLDGKVSDKEQTKVDAAKSRLALRSPDVPVGVTNLIADALSSAKEKGELGFCRLNDMTRCGACGKTAEYARYKSGYRKGEKNLSRQIKFRGIDLDTSFVRIAGYAGVGCCLDCWADVQPLLTASLVGVKAQLPAMLRTKGEPVYKKYRHRKCSCGWTGHDGQMRYELTIFGDGWFPSRCPSCGEGGAMSRTVARLDGYDVVDVAGPGLSDPYAIDAARPAAGSTER